MISIPLGLLIGIIYGLFFVTQQRRAFSFNQTTFTRHLATSLLLSMFRFTILAFCIVYILHSPTINPILILLSSTLAFWYIVRNKRVADHEQC